MGTSRSMSAAILLAAVAVASGQAPLFHSTLDDTASITSTGGALQSTAPNYVPGVIGNAFQSTGTSWALWNNAAVASLFGAWNNGQGITVDLYFQGPAWSTHSGDSGLWSIGKRSPDRYFLLTVRNGRLRLLFGGSDGVQYKYSLNGYLTAGEGAPDVPLADNVPYRLTIRQANGAFDVYVDDIGGNVYSNSMPVFSASNLPSGYTWDLPTSGGSPARGMSVGARYPFDNPFTVGALKTGEWVDNVRVFNGFFTPAQLDAGGYPVASVQADKTIGRPPLLVQFDGSASHDTDGGSIVKYEWDFDNDNVIDSTSGAIVSHTYAASGDFVCKLTVTDNENKTASATVALHILSPEIAPVTAIMPTGSQLSGSQVLTSITADGYTVTDFLGPTVIEFDGTVGNTANNGLCAIGSDHYKAMQGLQLGRGITGISGGDAMRTYFPPGVAISGDGTPRPDIFVLEYASTKDNFLVDLLTNEPGEWPTIAFTVQVVTADYSPTDTRMTAFDGNAPVGGVGIDLDAIAVSGVRGIQIPDWDGVSGFTGIDPCVVAAVRPAGMTFPPVAVISAWPTSGGAPLPVSFDASCGSYDPDGDISYGWDFTNDGTTDATGMTTTNTYTSGGSFTAKLTVTDAHSLTGSATAQIDIVGMNPKRRIIEMDPWGTLPAGSYPLVSVTTEYPGGTETFTETSLVGPPDTAHVEVVGSMTGAGAGATTPQEAMVGLELGSTVSGLNAEGEFLTGYFADDVRIKPDGTGAPEIFVIEGTTSTDNFQIELLTTGPGEWPEVIVATIQIRSSDYGPTSTVIGGSSRGGIGLDLDALGVTNIRGVRLPGADGLGGTTGVDPVIIAGRAARCNQPPQDVDIDGDVDLSDFSDFQTCFNGPNRPWTDSADPAVCACLDATKDGDVDLQDFGVFQACFNGPNRPVPQPTCDNANSIGG